MDQLERIEQMEKNLDAVRKAVDELDNAFTAYLACQESLYELDSYYQSDLWMKDYEDDSSGLIPSDLKRGVLSEDAVYNLLSDNQELLIRMDEAISGLLERRS